MKRMRKMWIMAVAASLVMTAFGNNEKSEQNAAPQTSKTVLVAYFSATGNTAKVAKSLTAATGATIFEIKPEKAYTSADLDWHNKQSRTTLEMNNEKARPAIANKVANMQQYQVIYLGFPIWWGKAPRIINTFLEQYNLKGKTIIPFCTSGGSGIEGAMKLIKASAPTANWKNGKLLNGNPSETELKSWAKTIK